MAFISAVTCDNENISIINCQVLMGRKNTLESYYYISSSCDRILKFYGGQIV